MSFLLLLAMSSLIGAVRDGNVTEVRQLLARGADPNAPEGVNDWTPLMHAVHKNQLGSVAALLDGHADPNRAVNGGTPLMMAAGYGYTPIVRLLLARGADPHIRDLDGETAVDYAVAGMADLDRFTFFRCQDDTV
ncbi:MAG TPA: ankyrin repeat domain-containing protein, partial [Thermoanaerobaculia bacterium]